MKKVGRVGKTTEPWVTEEFKDTICEKAQGIKYVKAPLKNKGMMENCHETLKAIFEVLDQYVLYNGKDIGSSNSTPESEVEHLGEEYGKCSNAIFDHILYNSLLTKLDSVIKLLYEF